jgi:hypothetical protein
MTAKKNTASKLLNEVCAIRRCDEAARYNFETQGHPNGDVAVAYCHNHSTMTPGHWDESPTPYSITVTGPFGEAAPDGTR